MFPLLRNSHPPATPATSALLRLPLSRDSRFPATFAPPLLPLRRDSPSAATPAPLRQAKKIAWLEKCVPSPSIECYKLSTLSTSLFALSFCGNNTRAQKSLLKGIEILIGMPEHGAVLIPKVAHILKALYDSGKTSGRKVALTYWYTYGLTLDTCMGWMHDNWIGAWSRPYDVWNNIPGYRDSY